MRKLILLLIIIAGLGGAYLYMTPSTDPVTEVYEFIQTRGVTEINVEILADTMYVQFTTPNLPDLLDLQYDIATEAASISGLPVNVESYYESEPIFALTGQENTLEFTDIRTVEFKIESELSVYDVLIDMVVVHESYAMVNVYYVGEESMFWADHQAMCLTVIQNAPWVDQVQINYLGDTASMPVTVNTDDLLAFYNGEITVDQYVASITTLQATG